MKMNKSDIDIKKNAKNTKTKLLAKIKWKI